VIAITLLLAALLTQAPAADPLDVVRRLAAANSNEARFDALTAILEARGVPFAVERFTIDKPLRGENRTEGRNIVASFGSGSEPLVVGAHYDAVRLPDGSLSRGAVDNAGSAAVLVEIAAGLKAQPPTGRVTLVWFDMEELGLIGSARYVEAHASDGIAAMINLDVNAYGDTLLFGASGTAENTTIRMAVLETCATKDLGCVAMPQMPPGDERSFVKAGIPSMSLATLPAIEAHQLWLMINAGNASGLAPGTAPAVMSTLHTAADVADKVDPAAVMRMADFTFSLLQQLVARP
jgi:Zn-dependent M28 family amino/carboxypeptidase